MNCPTINGSTGNSTGKKRISWSSYSYNSRPDAASNNGRWSSSSSAAASEALVDSAATVNEGSMANISVSSWGLIDTSDIHTTERMMSRLLAANRCHAATSPKLPTISHSSAHSGKSATTDFSGNCQGGDDVDTASMSLSSWAGMDLDDYEEEEEDPTSRRGRAAARTRARVASRLAESDSAIRYSCEIYEPVVSPRFNRIPRLSRPGLDTKPPPSPPTIPKSPSSYDESNNSLDETVRRRNHTSTDVDAYASALQNKNNLEEDIPRGEEETKEEDPEEQEEDRLIEEEAAAVTAAAATMLVVDPTTPIPAAATRRHSAISSSSSKTTTKHKNTGGVSSGKKGKRLSWSPSTFSSHNSTPTTRGVDTAKSPPPVTTTTTTNTTSRGIRSCRLFSSSSSSSQQRSTSSSSSSSSQPPPNAAAAKEKQQQQPQWKQRLQFVPVRASRFHI